MDRLETEVSTATRLRSLRFQVETVASMLTPGWTVPESVPPILTAAAGELGKLSEELDGYFRDLLKERHDRRLASMKSSLKRSLRPPKRKR